MASTDEPKGPDEPRGPDEPEGPGNDPVIEREFYKGLLDLGSADEPEPLLEQALATIVKASGAQAAYLELRGVADDDRAPPRYWRAHGYSDDAIATIRASISTGIVARALAEGRTITTPSAVADPSFRDQPSVLRNGIQAVICAPIGKPPMGVIYLQGPRSSLHFPERNLKAVELFARQLSTVAASLLALRGESEPLQDATRELRKQFRCDGIIGHSAALARTLREAAQVSPLPITLLLAGPAGTGKSALARAICANSPRATAPFFDLNCATIPEGQLEGDLFGVEPGTFTGAVRKKGKVTEASGGTLFLDEVAELSLGSQAKLLQLLQERRYYPVGSNKALVADVRIISATNADLKVRVAEKRFREDLYYRLAVMTIVLPGLEQRREDIPELVTYFCAEACKRHGLPAILQPTRRARFACREAPWPGNIRQLENALEAAVVRASYEHSSVVDEHHIFPDAPRGDGAPLTFREATQRAQRRHVEEALLRNDWNITKTAAELDVNRQYLHELIQALGLKRPGK